MIIPMSQITVGGSDKSLVSVELALPCRPVRILTNHGRFQGGHVFFDDFLITGITYKAKGQGASIWGPWWPAGSSSPGSLFGPEFITRDLTFEMPMLPAGDIVEVHIVNLNPSCRWFSCCLEVVPGSEARDMAIQGAGAERWQPQKKE